jgi:hypothetical protein
VSSRRSRHHASLRADSCGAAFIRELLRAEVDPLKGKVDVIDGKVDLLLDRQRNG